MAKSWTVPAVAVGLLLAAAPAAAWTPDFDTAFDPFPHRGMRQRPNAVDVALPVAKPVITSTRTSAPRLQPVVQGDLSRRLADYCRRPGKSSLSWIRVDGRRHYCTR